MSARSTHRTVAARVARAFDGIPDRHALAEARRRDICAYVHMWLEPPHVAAVSGVPNAPHAPPPLTWIYNAVIVSRGWTISPSTVAAIHRRYCYRR